MVKVGWGVSVAVGVLVRVGVGVEVGASNETAMLKMIVRNTLIKINRILGLLKIHVIFSAPSQPLRSVPMGRADLAVGVTPKVPNRGK